MTRFFFRIITLLCAPEIEKEITSFLNGFLSPSELYTEPMKSYWKNPDQGELSGSFLCSRSIAEIQTVLADHWEGEVADAQWSNIRIPHAVFVWLTIQ